MINKNFKKVLCHALAAALVVTSVAGVPMVSTTTASAEEEITKVIYRNGFEDGEYQGIIGRGEVALEVSTSVHHDVGNNSLTITERKFDWNGIQLPLEGIAKAGETYGFKAYAKQDTGADIKFDLGVSYKAQGATDPSYAQVASQVNGKSGEWVELAGSLTIPAGATEIAMYIQNASATADFFVDDISITGKGAKGFDPDVDLYSSMVKKGVFSTGNNARIKATIAKAREGKDVSLAYIGGSITEGGGYKPNSACYAEVSAVAFAKKYGKDGGKNVHFINAGMSGTPSDIGVVRYNRDVIDRLPEGSDHPDVLFVEFAVNDSGCESKGGAYEGLIRQALKSGSAVVLVFSVFQGLNTVEENNYRKYATAYDLPVVSTGNAIRDLYSSEGFNKKEFETWFYNDSLHPNANGYKLMADCILELVDRCDKEEAELDNITDVDAIKAVTSDLYTGIKMIDCTTTADSDKAIGMIKKGSFDSKDSASPSFQYTYKGQAGAKWFPENWMHPAKPTSDDSLVFDVNCQTFMLVYKESSEKAYGKANLYVDGVKKATLSCFNSSGWNNGKVYIAVKDTKSAMHRIQLKMADGNESKKFTLYAVGYKTDGAEATDLGAVVEPSRAPTATPTPSVAPTSAPGTDATPAPSVAPGTVPTPDIPVVAPAAVSVAKVSGVKAKSKKLKATLTWKKVKGANGYQVVYTTDKKVKKSLKKLLVKKNTAKTAKLKKGKKYFVKVRAYKVVDGKKVYGAYSKVLSFKAK